MLTVFTTTGLFSVPQPRLWSPNRCKCLRPGAQPGAQAVAGLQHRWNNRDVVGSPAWPEGSPWRVPALQERLSGTMRRGDALGVKGQFRCVKLFHGRSKALGECLDAISFKQCKQVCGSWALVLMVGVVVIFMSQTLTGRASSRVQAGQAVSGGHRGQLLSTGV